MKTKLISIILCLCMVLPLFTFTVQAEEEVTLTNVFQGKSISSTVTAHGSYPATKAVDGDTTWGTRFSSKSSSITSGSVTIDLGTNHVLSSIRLYDVYTAKDITVNYVVEAGITSDGVTSYSEAATASQVTINSTSFYLDIPFDTYINADKIKISFTRSASASVMINEIIGYGYEGTYTPPVVEEPEEEEETVDSAGYDALKLWYNTPAVDDDEGSTKSDATGVYSMTKYGYKGWEHQALPLGNGYLGAMVFGRTDNERIQLTENSLSSTYQTSGLTNFAETYIDFNHAESDVTDYYRDLNLDEGTSHVSYTYDGVDYDREYITSYPDKVMAIKLTASEAGKLSFTLRPTIPYLHAGTSSIAKKTGTVNASGDTVTIKGVYGVFGVKYEGQFTIVPRGSNYTMTASNDDNGDNGTLTLSGADSAIIYIAIGTNYPMDSKDVFSDANANKLDDAITAEQVTAKLKGYIDAAKANGYDKIRENHLADYKEYFGRVKLDLNTEVPAIPTNELVDNYAAGTYNSYLEVLLFHYGRYMLICSSREGTLPANLQGIWNRYRSGVCMVGYWHNVNVQLTYWPVFVTNLTDMFKSYTDYFDRALPTLKKLSTNLLIEEGLETSESGDNGWNLGTGASPYWVQKGNYAYTGNDGNGCGPFLAETFWDYYRFTGDLDILENWVYPVIRDCANYSSRVVSDTGDGLYLTRKSASPENHVNGSSNYQPSKGDLYPQGTTYDQSLIYDVMNYALTGAEILKNAGRMTENEYNTDEALVRCRERIGKLDPIKIGTSGQIKEFREETYYAEYGQSNHRHISHLMGIYPGTIVNYDTPAWQDAARTTLPLRNSKANDWKWAMPTRAVVWARLGDGNQAMAQMRKMTSAENGLRHNLLTGTPTFQIDGNCGSTAAFSEMLLQSHMDYIQPLAALPDDWAKGSFDGLLARGAFEMGATWKDGKATQIRVLSQKGNNCVIKYPGVGSATVKDSAGNTVSYTKNANDMITFATTAGESYVISSIPAVAETAVVTDLAISGTDLVDENRKTTLSWTASADAANYNVYYAVNDSAAYTLAGNTAETSYQIPAEFSSETDRVTYAVTAVSADGVESDRVWLNENPLGPIMEAKGSLNEENKFVITITPTYTVDSYNIYCVNSAGEKALVKNTADTVITIPDASPFYEIYTVVAVDNGEESGEAEVAFLENVALKKTVTTNIADNGSALPVSGITDGTSGRYASHAGSGTKPLIVEIDLGDVYKVSRVMLSERWMPEYTDKQAGIIIETGVTSWDGNTEWTTHTSDFMKSTGSSSGTIVEDVFYFDEITEADKLRVTYTRTEYDTSTNYTITEIELYGVYEREYGAKNILLGKTVVDKSGHSVNSSLPLKNITDGNTSSRYASSYSSTLRDLILEIDLENLYVVGGADFWQYFLNSSTSPSYDDVLTGVDVDAGVTIDGETNWTAAYKDIQLTGSHGKTGQAASVSFGDMFLADKMRFTFKVDTTDVNTVSNKISHTISEIILYGYDVNTVGNAAKGVLAETNLSPVSSAYKEAFVTDEKPSSTAFSTGALGRNRPCEVTLHLDGSYNLYQIKLYELISDAGKTSSDNTKVEIGVTSGGTTTWTTARETVALASGESGSVQENVIVLDKAYKGDKVRITLQSSEGINVNYGYSISEIKVYGDNKLDNFGFGEIKLMSGENELEFNRQNISSASNILKLSYNGMSEGKELEAFVAFYDESGDITSVARGTLLNGNLTFDTSVASGETTAKIVVFTWDNLTDIKPLLPTFGKYIPEN